MTESRPNAAWIAPPRTGTVASAPVVPRGRCAALTLGRRAHDPVVADRAGGARGRRLELLAEDAFAHLEHDLGDGLGFVIGARHGDIEIVEHVVVGLA